MGQSTRTPDTSSADLQRLISIGIALSAERDISRLLERIVVEAMALCNADGGTLYVRTKENSLRFEIMRTLSLDIRLGGTTGEEITLPDVPLFDDDGEPNRHNVASHCAHTKLSVNIEDAYTAEGFDFSGTRKFDELNHYRSTSFLAIPMMTQEQEVIGVLQLLNAQDG